MFIIYRGHRLNVAIARRLVKIDMIGLPNIIAGEKLFPEYIQEDADPEALAADAYEVVSNEDNLNGMLQSCRRVRNALSGGDTSGKMANLVLELANEKMNGSENG